MEREVAGSLHADGAHDGALTTREAQGRVADGSFGRMLATVSIRWNSNMTEIVFVVEEDPEGGYTARALGESIFTQADDMNSLREMVRDAVRCHFLDAAARPIFKERNFS